MAGLMWLSPLARHPRGLPPWANPAVEGDQWPGDSGPLEGLEEQSVRPLASHEGARYFVVASTHQQAACLCGFEEVSVQHSVAGCAVAGGSAITVEVKIPSFKMMLVREDADTAALEESAWSRTRENIADA